MPQDLTEDLLDILASRFQAAAKGYRCRLELDYIIPGTTEEGEDADLNQAFGTVLADHDRHEWNHVVGFPGGDGAFFEFDMGSAFGPVVNLNDGSAATNSTIRNGVVINPSNQFKSVIYSDLGAAFEVTRHLFAGANFLDDIGSITFESSDDASTWTPIAGAWSGTLENIGGADYKPFIFDAPVTARYFSLVLEHFGVSFDGIDMHTWQIRGIAEEIIPDSLGTLSLQPRRVSIDKSRRMSASQLTVEIPRELIGASLLDAIQTNAPVRVWQWYGDEDDPPRTFTGLLDSLKEGRDPRTVTLVARDLMKRLIVQNFEAIGPQGADEEDTVRTEANGVYLERDADYIVNDILDRAGWPTADRAIAATGYAIDEYIISDGASWAEAIIGENALTGLTGYDAWADEATGIFHFAPMLANAAPDSDTEPVPDYTYEVATTETDNLTSRNILHLDREIDDYELKTRVKVRGNLATAVAAFTEVWHTNKFNKPVGLWWDPTDASFLRVLDRGTKKIYRLRQSDREKVGTGIWPLDISGDVAHPLGLSGDPADSDVFWVLDAGWRTGNGNSASIHKYDASSGAHLDEFSLPDGQWSDIKASASFLWLTNYGTNKLHKRSKADGTNITTYDGPTVNGNVQVNPTGVAVDGTTLLTFWDGKARFLLTDESDPETLDPSTPLLDGNGIIRTAGSKIFGGEMDTATDAHLFACSDDLGIVWKFALTEPSTDEVFSEVIDTDLEDELGFLSGAEDREHDTHPAAADHPFEIRRATVTLEKTITNLAQATETALRVLDQLAHRREVTDWAVVGNPRHQRGDLHQLTDPVTGIGALYIVDTYRDNMDERGYLATVAYVPYRPVY